MSMETVRLIGEVARAAREHGASSDPDFFDLKGRAFEAVAAEDPHQAVEATAMAARAYARAAELRRGRSS